MHGLASWQEFAISSGQVLNAPVWWPDWASKNSEKKRALWHGTRPLWLMLPDSDATLYSLRLLLGNGLLPILLPIIGVVELCDLCRRPARAFAKAALAEWEDWRPWLTSRGITLVCLVAVEAIAQSGWPRHLAVASALLWHATSATLAMVAAAAILVAMALWTCGAMPRLLLAITPRAATLLSIAALIIAWPA